MIPKDKITYTNTAISVVFGGKRKVLSTSPYHGGLREDLKAVFNLDGKTASGDPPFLYADTYEEHLRIAAEKDVHLSPDTCTGLMTAAAMKNAARCEMKFENISVEAVVTAGLDGNAGRVGEDAKWHENRGIWRNTEETSRAKALLGTINILLFLDANLIDGALERALVTCTEAKCAAIQELCIGSTYSSGIATGSGTDGTILVSNMESNTVITEAGKNCKVGELIGKTVKQAVKEALYKQTKVCAESQRNVFQRLGRYGITPEFLLEYALQQQYITENRQTEFMKKAEVWANEKDFAVWAALEAHLLDEYNWGLLEAEDFLQAEQKLLAAYNKVGNIAARTREIWMLRNILGLGV